MKTPIFAILSRATPWSRSVLSLLVIALLAPLGCSSETDASTCVTVDASCSPLYPATFDNVFERTLKPTCAQSGASCHAPEGNQGGLTFDTADDSYARLLGEEGGKARVIAGDAECSLLTARLEATEPSQVMPPGQALKAAERCAIEQWIANGASR